MPRLRESSAAKLTAGLLLVATLTVVCRSGLGVNATTAGFCYLIVVLFLATAWGRLAAVPASLAAVLCFNYYFLPPLGRFTIADPQNWVALFTFLATALVASHLSDRARTQALEAQRRQQETEQLYALSRAILLCDPKESMAAQAVRHIAQVFDCDAVALYDAASGDVVHGGAGSIDGAEARLLEAARTGSQQSEGALSVAPVTLGGRPIGSLALRASQVSDGAWRALLNLVAIALERARTEEAANRAEVARVSEEFKSTLLDAVAHEFKTPLTSIRAASTSLLSGGGQEQPESRELLSIIDEESARLGRLVSEAARMAQIEAGTIQMALRAVDLDSLMRDLLADFRPRLEGRPLHVNLPVGLRPVWADRELLTLALRQLLDNALKYSPPASALRIELRQVGEALEVSVEDAGPGIPERDRQRVFERFYRRESGRGKVPGSGLGLHIAREIFRAHGGEVAMEGGAAGGSLFRASLPLRQGEDEA